MPKITTSPDAREIGSGKVGSPPGADTLPNAHLPTTIMCSTGVLTLVNCHFLWMISCRVREFIPTKAQFFTITCYPKETNIQGSN